MRNICYIINPIAGTRAKKDLQAFIETATTKAGIPFMILPSVADGNYDFLHPIIKEKKITDVVVAGGDGTVSQVVNGLMKLDVNIGIIPCGSGNGLAYTAGIPKDPAKALKIVFAGRSARTDGFYLNDHFACMLCGLGFDAKVAHDFAQQPKRGLSTYVKQVVRNFFGAKTFPFDITVGGKTFSTDAYFISIANSNQFGNHFTIAPAASLSDGLLDIVIVTKQNKLSMILQTLKQVRGKNKLVPETVIDDTKAVIYFQTNQLQIQNKAEAYLHIDGDPAETSKEIKVQVLPECFKLLRP